MLVHTADKLGRGHSVAVVTDEQNLHEVFKADSTEEVDELILSPIHRLHSGERDVQSAFKVGHDLLPQRMTLLEIPALIREAID